MASGKKSSIIPLIAINIILFVLQTVIPKLSDSFLLVSSDVITRPWILITSMFLHGGMMHLIFNMYALFIFGPLIEQRIGRSRFIFIYFASGILANVAFAFFRPELRALGASGAIMGILGVTIMLLPDLKVLLFFAIPMSLRTAGIIFALFDLFGVFYMPGIANIAHLGGLACGLLYGWHLLKIKKQYNRTFVKPKKKSTFEESIHMSSDEVNEYIRRGRL